MGNGLINISQQLLLNAKLNQATENLVDNLATINEAELSNQLINDDDKKAFWRLQSVGIYPACKNFSGRW